MKVQIILVKYSPKYNAISQRYILTMDNELEAAKYIFKNRKHPLQYYVIGDDTWKQKIDTFFGFFYNTNRSYKKEFKKIKKGRLSIKRYNSGGFDY